MRSLIGLATVIPAIGLCAVVLTAILKEIHAPWLVYGAAAVLAASHGVGLTVALSRELLRREPRAGAAVLARARTDGWCFALGNLSAFAVWVGLVLGGWGVVDAWFATLWGLAAAAGMGWMVWRVLRVAFPPWPQAAVDEIKARFAEELKADGGGPFTGPGTMNDVARIQMGLLQEYADRNPAVARHEVRICRELGRMLGR